MKYPLALAFLVILCGCETPPGNAAVQTEAAAIDIGKAACRPTRERAETDTHFNAKITEYEDRLHDHWEGQYADGMWDVGGGRRFNPRPAKCHDIQVQIDAMTGKPHECMECVTVG